MTLDQSDKDGLVEAVANATPTDTMMVTVQTYDRRPLSGADFWELQDAINAACAARAGAWGYAIPVSNAHEKQTTIVLISVRVPS